MWFRVTPKNERGQILFHDSQVSMVDHDVTADGTAVIHLRCGAIVRTNVARERLIAAISGAMDLDELDSPKIRKAPECVEKPPTSYETAMHLLNKIAVNLGDKLCGCAGCQRCERRQDCPWPDLAGEIMQFLLDSTSRTPKGEK